MGLGYVEGYTHDYVRHGTTTLFAARDIATGRVLAQCRKRHRHEEFLGFLRLLDREVPSIIDKVTRVLRLRISGTAHEVP